MGFREARDRPTVGVNVGVVVGMGGVGVKDLVGLDVGVLVEVLTGVQVAVQVAVVTGVQSCR